MEALSLKNSPRYVRIAVDIAYRIYRGEFKEGDKLRGRSILSGEYNVSPETIRRSATLLQNMGVVEVHEKSGIYVKSQENAKDFIERFTTTDKLNTLIHEIKKLRAQKEEIEKKIVENMEILMEHTIHFRNIDTTSHYEETIHEKSHLVGKTILEAQFWQNTNATIIAVKRGSDTFLSPGAYFEFQEKDVICFVSSKENVKKVREYINSSE